MLRKLFILLAVIVFVSLFLYRPYATSDPAANPLDPSMEDLTRVEYPSLVAIPWEPLFIRPQDTVESLFGDRWPLIARFNRIDRRHIYPGMTIKVPKDPSILKDYTPMPAVYDPARNHGKYILVNMTEQWLGAYEFGRLKFSMPAATGKDATPTPIGLFRVDARHRYHTSSLYKTENDEDQYPMDNAIRFYIGPDNVSYWIHARDLPGRPASHGCIGVFDEDMQLRMYGMPDEPILLDSRKLYNWAVGEDEYEDDTGELEELEDGATVEIIGTNPVYRKGSRFF